MCRNKSSHQGDSAQPGGHACERRGIGWRGPKEQRCHQSRDHKRGHDPERATHRVRRDRRSFRRDAAVTSGHRQRQRNVVLQRGGAGASSAGRASVAQTAGFAVCGFSWGMRRIKFG